jgi:hypothetical protein
MRIMGGIQSAFRQGEADVGVRLEGHARGRVHSGGLAAKVEMEVDV